MLIISDLTAVLARVNSGGAAPIEAYHDATHRLAEAQSLYTHGLLSLEQRAYVEQLYFAICNKVRGLLQPAIRSQREILDELNEKLADKYFCNFSLFQSIPDVWAIDQIFPIVPLSRLQEQPTRRGVIEDITCDSDGRIDHYVDREGVDASLPLHEINSAEPYILGIFLVGAYQEILGDMHNLFGDTHSVNVELDGNGGYRILEQHTGDTVEHVLRYVQYNTEELKNAYRDKIDQAQLDGVQQQQYYAELVEGLLGYTYLEE